MEEEEGDVLSHPSIKFVAFCFDHFSQAERQTRSLLRPSHTSFLDLKLSSTPSPSVFRDLSFGHSVCQSGAGRKQERKGGGSSDCQIGESASEHLRGGRSHRAEEVSRAPCGRRRATRSPDDATMRKRSVLKSAFPYVQNDLNLPCACVQVGCRNQAMYP